MHAFFCRDARAPQTLRLRADRTCWTAGTMTTCWSSARSRASYSRSPGSAPCARCSGKASVLEVGEQEVETPVCSPFGVSADGSACRRAEDSLRRSEVCVRQYGALRGVLCPPHPRSSGPRFGEHGDSATRIEMQRIPVPAAGQAGCWETQSVIVC